MFQEICLRLNLLSICPNVLALKMMLLLMYYFVLFKYRLGRSGIHPALGYRVGLLL